MQQLIAGPQIYICDECVGLCNEIIEERLAEHSATEQNEFALHKPREIAAVSYTHLDVYKRQLRSFRESCEPETWREARHAACA